MEEIAISKWGAIEEAVSLDSKFKSANQKTLFIYISKIIRHCSLSIRFRLRDILIVQTALHSDGTESEFEY